MTQPSFSSGHWVGWCQCTVSRAASEQDVFPMTCFQRSIFSATRPKCYWLLAAVSAALLATAWQPGESPPAPSPMFYLGMCCFAAAQPEAVFGSVKSLIGCLAGCASSIGEKLALQVGTLLSSRCRSNGCGRRLVIVCAELVACQGLDMQARVSLYGNGPATTKSNTRASTSVAPYWHRLVCTLS